MEWHVNLSSVWYEVLLALIENSSVDSNLHIVVHYSSGVFYSIVKSHVAIFSTHPELSITVVFLENIIDHLGQLSRELCFNLFLDFFTNEDLEDWN